jgi:hypothetical protein
VGSTGSAKEPRSICAVLSNATCYSAVGSTDAGDVDTGDAAKLKYFGFASGVVVKVMVKCNYNTHEASNVSD